MPRKGCAYDGDCGISLVSLLSFVSYGSQLCFFSGIPFNRLGNFGIHFHNCKGNTFRTQETHPIKRYLELTSIPPLQTAYLKKLYIYIYVQFSFCEVCTCYGMGGNQFWVLQSL